MIKDSGKGLLLAVLGGRRCCGCGERQSEQFTMVSLSAEGYDDMDLKRQGK